MFFIVSRLLGFFITPSNILVGVGLVGVVLLPTRFSRVGCRLVVASVVMIVAVGVLPLWVALSLPLEDRLPQWDPSSGAPNGIIVLGGVISPSITVARHQVTLTEAAQRVTTAVELARRYPAARVVFSGGNSDLFNPGVSEARAVGAFRKVGFPVEAYPVNYRTTGSDELLSISGALMGGIGNTDDAVHEWLGLLAYWMTGRIAHLFPGPVLPTRRSSAAQEIASPLTQHAKR